MRVLVVDDDPDILGLLRTWLEKLGHEVSTATRGSEAIRAALLDDADLLVCDLMLPDLRGTEVIRAIKAQAPNLPVIVVSAFDRDTWEKDCLDAGATAFMQKPLRFAAFKNEIELVERGRANMHVLVVDPDPTHRRRLELGLASYGCSVTACSALPPGGESLGLERPGLVLVDSSDPALSRVCAWARSNEVPVAVMCREPTPDDEERLLRMGAAMVVRKPVEVEALVVQTRFIAG